MNSEQNESGTGAWIFLSHSHKDLAKVREIRNQLELRGHNPLIFFLKCLEDDNSELPELLKREIEARHWFILCDSPNAKVSKWVQEEVKMIQALEGKTFVTVDLSEDMESQLHKLIELSKRATVFLSYAEADLSMARLMADYLTAADYTVWFHDNIEPSVNFIDEVQQAIEQAAERGFVLLLLSKNLSKSRQCIEEIQYACRKGAKSPKGKILPVMIDDYKQIDAALPPELSFVVTSIHWFDLTSGPFEERMELLVSILKKLEP